MKIMILWVIVLSVSLLGAPAMASQTKAHSCQVFIEQLRPELGSHSSGAVGVKLKIDIPWGEKYIDAGYIARTTTRDLGNDPRECHNPRIDGAWELVHASDSDNGMTHYGEFYFRFPVASGSTGGTCNGYHWSWEAAFFVQTDKNTYWVNPDFDEGRYFVIDLRLMDSLLSTYNPIDRTTRPGSRFQSYNPAVCE